MFDIPPYADRNLALLQSLRGRTNRRMRRWTSLPPDEALRLARGPLELDAGDACRLELTVDARRTSGGAG